MGTVIVIVQRAEGLEQLLKICSASDLQLVNGHVREIHYIPEVAEGFGKDIVKRLRDCDWVLSVGWIPE